MERKAAEKLGEWSEKQRVWLEKEGELLERCSLLIAQQKASAIEHELQESLFQALELRVKAREESEQRAITPRELGDDCQSAREEETKVLRTHVQELEEELSAVSRKVVHPEDSQAGETDMQQEVASTNWRSHRLSVNKLKQARLVQRTVPLVEKGPSMQMWAAVAAGQPDEAYESGDSAPESTTHTPRLSWGPLPDVVLSRRKSTPLHDEEKIDLANPDLSEARRYSAAIDMLLLKELERDQQLELQANTLAEARQENSALSLSLALAQEEHSSRARENEALRELTADLTQQLADLTAKYQESAAKQTEMAAAVAQVNQANQQLADLTTKYQEMETTCQALQASEQEREVDDYQESALRQLTSQLSAQLQEMTGTCCCFVNYVLESCLMAMRANKCTTCETSCGCIVGRIR